MRRGVEQGRVKQNFSHGRSKTVVVETKRRRTITAPGAAPSPIESKVKPASQTAPKPAPAAPAPAGITLGGLIAGLLLVRRRLDS